MDESSTILKMIKPDGVIPLKINRSHLMKSAIELPQALSEELLLNVNFYSCIALLMI